MVANGAARKGVWGERGKKAAPLLRSAALPSRRAPTNRSNETERGRVEGRNREKGNGRDYIAAYAPRRSLFLRRAAETLTHGEGTNYLVILLAENFAPPAVLRRVPGPYWRVRRRRGVVQTNVLAVASRYVFEKPSEGLRLAKLLSPKAEISYGPRDITCG